ncbi:Importin subunit beta-1 [Morella rubra]|uniref:Importin subunit beta-1 n=1 Tax=Morella rubra TaxID=262757 RepID=A0A6A1VMP5_9ROSI|nr:Importin subunit beta-1 [Morella rubra]
MGPWKTRERVHWRGLTWPVGLVILLFVKTREIQLAIWFVSSFCTRSIRNLILHILFVIPNSGLSNLNNLQIGDETQRFQLHHNAAVLQQASHVFDIKLSEHLERKGQEILAMFLEVFACRSSTVHEEAMLAIGSLTYAYGPEFEKYMGEFYPYLEMELQNFEEYQVCSITAGDLGVVGDICRAWTGRFVQPHIFSCFGDIALAIGEHFERYVLYAIQAMPQVAEVCAHINADDEELMEYGNQLRRIFEANSGFKT